MVNVVPPVLSVKYIEKFKIKKFYFVKDIIRFQWT